MIKGMIFDFNGVMINDYPIQKQAWDKISQIIRGKVCTDEEMIKKIRGVPAKEIIKWMGKAQLTEERILQLVEEKRKNTQELYLASPLTVLNKGLEPFLDNLKEKNIPRTIATSSSFKEMQFSFSHLKLNRWFAIEEIIFNDGSYRGKPAPDVYLRAAALLNLNPAECFVFEDAISGITAAYLAGVKKIIAVGSDERLLELKKLPGVVKGIHDFTEIKVEDLQLQEF